MDAILGSAKIDSQSHHRNGSQARNALKVNTEKSKQGRYEETVESLQKESKGEKTIVKRASCIRIWISQYPSTLRGNVLSWEEFRDSALTRWGETLEKLQSNCNECS